MGRYYFTYGNSGKQPFIGGWTIVTAPNRDIACKLFRAIHPDRMLGFLNCSSVYNEDEFILSGISERAGKGPRCHEHIIFKHEVYTRFEEDGKA